MTAAEFSFAAFVACNMLRVAAYLPQMVQIVRRHAAAAAISYPTWTLFTAANGSTAIYASVVLADATLTCLHAFNTLCCGAVVGLALWRQGTPRDR